MIASSPISASFLAICSAHLDMTLNTPLRLTLVIWANLASGAALPSLFNSLKPVGMAAPLMQTWTAPKRAITALIAFCTDSSSLTSVCTNIACLIDGGIELLEHAEQSLGVRPEGTTADGSFTLEEVECLAHCDKAPCLQVNYRFFGPVTPDDFDRLCVDLRAGRLDRDVPRHGVLDREPRPHPMSAARDGA